MQRKTKRPKASSAKAAVPANLQDGPPDAAAESEGATLRWSVEQRLAFIDERLFWIGEVNRTDLVRRFGISMSQASGDIARYLALSPKGVGYDRSTKRYVSGRDFIPVIAPPHAARLLGEMRLIGVGAIASSEATLGALPPFAATPVPERPVDAFVLRAVWHAIRDRKVLSVKYQSMSRPTPMRRLIEPHSLVHDGFRWHVRAYDREHMSFRDFVLGRMSQPEIGEMAAAEAEDDADWNATVPLVIAPHPGLTPAQAKAIAIDYGIRGGSITIPVRRALLFYALRRLGLDVRPNIRPPREQHIVLLNRDEVEAVRGPREPLQEP